MQETTHFTHIDAAGNAVMVDVTEKNSTVREATATGFIGMSEACYEMIREGRMKKGDVLSVAQVAGIMGAKKNSELIPLCHILNLTKVLVEFDLDARPLHPKGGCRYIKAACTAKCEGKTGVEMEALTGVSVALLTVYDMCKAVDKSMEITEISLLEKTGGKSGHYLRGETGYGIAKAAAEKKTDEKAIEKTAETAKDNAAEKTTEEGTDKASDITKEMTKDVEADRTKALQKNHENRDSYGRDINYLRISVTDRCNLRCRYCMPDGIDLKSHREILSYDEIRLIAEAGAEFGIRNLKITGGEPLVRKGVEELIRSLKEIPGIDTVTITTNGILLKEKLPALLAAGIDGINISMDTLNRERYKAVTGFDEHETVMEAIRASVASGVKTKLNVAVMKGFNDDEVLALCRMAKDMPLHVRFIEMMPIGAGKDMQGISNDVLLEEIKRAYPLMEEDKTVYGNGPASYYHIPGFMGSIGFISAVNHKFCDRCNRMRLCSTGELKYCLCYEDGLDLRALIRDAETAEEKRAAVRRAFVRAMELKPKEHCFEDRARISELKKMSQIGG